MKKLLVVLLALGVMVMSGSMILACDVPNAGHPDLTGQHDINAYVCPFAQITWGRVSQTILEGDGTASVTPGSIGFDVESNCTVKVDIAGEDFVGCYFSSKSILPTKYSLTPSFSWNEKKDYSSAISSGILDYLLNDCVKRSYTVYYKATPKTAVISGTHAGSYEGKIKVTVTQLNALDNGFKKFSIPSHDCDYL